MSPVARRFDPSNTSCWVTTYAHPHAHTRTSQTPLARAQQDLEPHTPWGPGWRWTVWKARWVRVRARWADWHPGPWPPPRASAAAVASRGPTSGRQRYLDSAHGEWRWVWECVLCTISMRARSRSTSLEVSTARATRGSTWKNSPIYAPPHLGQRRWATARLVGTSCRGSSSAPAPGSDGDGRGVVGVDIGVLRIPNHMLTLLHREHCGAMMVSLVWTVPNGLHHRALHKQRHRTVRRFRILQSLLRSARAHGSDESLSQAVPPLPPRQHQIPRASIPRSRRRAKSSARCRRACRSTAPCRPRSGRRRSRAGTRAISDWTESATRARRTVCYSVPPPNQSRASHGTGQPPAIAVRPSSRAGSV